MEQKKNCRTCSKEIDNKRRSKVFCNMECYKNYMVKPKEQPKQVSIAINKSDPNWMARLMNFLSGK